MTQDTLVINTPDGIAYYRLASLKGQLKLEQAGMKMSHGKALRPQIAAEFGLSPRTPHAKYIEVIQTRMDAMLKAKTESQSK